VFGKGSTDELLSRCLADPLVHHGHHSGWTIHALCHVQALLTNGTICDTEMETTSEESLSAECVSANMKSHFSNLILLGTSMNTDDNTRPGNPNETPKKGLWMV
jgi:hypothetical protein